MGSLHARVRNGGRKEMKAGCAADPDQQGWVTNGCWRVPQGISKLRKCAKSPNNPSSLC